MSNPSAQIISHILSSEYNKAKQLITESMNEKLGILLEEKLLEYGPTLFESKKYKCSCGEKNCDCAKTSKK